MTDKRLRVDPRIPVGARQMTLEPWGPAAWSACLTELCGVIQTGFGGTNFCHLISFWCVYFGNGLRPMLEIGLK